MKLSREFRVDSVVPPKEWMLFDGCPVCRLLRDAAQKDKLISSLELEKAFADAQSETEVV